VIPPISPPTALSLPLRTPRAVERGPICPPPTVSPRFTIDGDDALEQFLARTCEKIAAGVRGPVPRRKLEALMLGGGYGRGEGGVLRTAAGERPYNDLEFYLCLRGNRHLNERRFGHALHVLGEILTPQAGIDVEFKITSLRELERSPVSMFSYDLIAGHRWLVGSDELLARCAHHREAARIPLSEATRLLMNRGSGLLLAKERLEQSAFTPADADFVRRNIAKAQLALGDAVLVTFGEYDRSVRERHRRVQRAAQTASLPWIREVCGHHAAGVEFKLRPERSTDSREALLARHVPVVELAREVWLWLESERLRVRFESPRAYALWPADKLPETGAARNLLVNLKTLGARALPGGRAHRHPRERVLNALALLLWEPEALTSPALLARLQSDLQTRAATFSGLMHAYRALWARVN
jgi:hypothetical protein